MEYSQPSFLICPESNAWSNWQQSAEDRPYPSEYVSRQSSQSLSDSVSYYSQFTVGYPHTCPLPQPQSPYQSMPFSYHSRPKSMSWPRGMFTAPPTLSAWPQNHTSLSAFYQECQYQQVPDTFVHPRMSVTPGPPGYVSIPEDPKPPMPSVPYEFDAVQSPEISPSETKNSSVTSPSSMQEASLHSTPLPVPMSLHSLPAQSGLLGLNCQFSESGPPSVVWPVQTDDESEPVRPNLVLGQPRPGPKVKEKKRRQSTQPNRTFACDFCDMKFDRKSNLKDHNRTHGVDKRCVPCHFPGCKKFYGRKADVNRHVRSFHQKDSVSCEHCHKTFLRSDSLTRHNVDNCRHQKEAEMNATRDSSRWHHRPRSDDEIGRLITKTETKKVHSLLEPARSPQQTIKRD